MSGICGWLAEMLSGTLPPDERDAVLGDIAETGERGVSGLLDVLGLVLRRQAQLWRHWRPWFGFVALATPFGMLLSLVSRRTADSSAIYLWLYVNNWSPVFIRNARFRNDLISTAGLFLGAYLMLACWSWTVGFALGLFSRRATLLNGVLFVLVAACMELSWAPQYFSFLPSMSRGRDFGSNAAVFAEGFYRVFFPLIVQVVLVVLPAIWGMRRGAGREKLA